MAKIEPITGAFENWKALLCHVMEDEDVEKMVIITKRKNGRYRSAHIGMGAEEMAYAATILLAWTTEAHSGDV